MKHLLFLAVFTLTLGACEKQDYTSLQEEQSIEQSNQLASITVEVLLDERHDSNPYGGCGNGTCASVYRAIVSLYPAGTTELGDQQPLFSSETDIRGRTTFKDLPAEGYAVFVDCYYGEDQQEVATPRGANRFVGFQF